jgi:hypothetical protein
MDGHIKKGTEPHVPAKSADKTPVVDQRITPPGKASVPGWGPCHGGGYR